MDNTLVKRAAHLTLKLSLGGLALLFLHAPSAKAQECCPDADQYTATAPAKVGASARKSIRIAANNRKQAKRELVARLEPATAPGASAPRKQKSQRRATLVVFNQPAKSLEKKE